MAPSIPDGTLDPLEQVTLLYALAEQIQRSRHVETIYEEAVEGVRRGAGADRCALLVLDDGLMRFAAWSSGVGESMRSGVEGYAPWRADARDPRPVVVEDAGSDERVAAIRDTLLEEGIRSLVCVPLLHRGRLLGEILLFHEGGAVPGEAGVRLAEAVAAHLAFAIWRRRSDADQAELLRRFDAERLVLESVVRQMPAAVMVADVPSGRVIMSNPQVAVVWGRELGRAREVAEYASWGGRAVAAGRELAAEEWPLARTVLRGETVAGEEIEIRRPGGSWGRIRMSSAPVLDGQGRQLAAVATVYDVTRERVEETRQAFMDAATGVLNASLELSATFGALAELLMGRYADWCVVYRRTDPGRIERVASSSSRSSASSEAADGFPPFSLRVDVDHPLTGVWRHGTPILALQSTVARALLVETGAGPWIAGAVDPVSAVILPLRAREETVGLLMVAREGGAYGEDDVALLDAVATRAGMAMDNALLYETARSADRAKSNFLAVMSHEVRTPLSAILGYADILTAEVHGDLNPKQRGHLERVKASVRHLSHLVDEILTYASMEAGRERVRRERVELVSVVRDVAGIMEPIAEAAGLELRVVTPATRLEVETDPSKLRQILINLLSNGIKYTPAGYVEVRLERHGSVARCVVIDTGPGIPAEHFEDVFEPFWQVGQSDGQKRVSGTGLGLAVARRLARLLGGDVRLRSEVGQGSEFSLELPAPGGPGGS